MAGAFAYGPARTFTAMNPDPAAQRKGVLLALLAVLLWSGNFIIARALHTTVPPVALAFWRWLCATLLLVPFAWGTLRREAASLRGCHWHILGTALTGITLFNTFIYVAGRTVPAIHLALIGTTAAPLFVLLFSYVFLRERLPAPTWVGALLCLAGLVTLLTKGNPTALGSLRFSTGDAWILAAGLSFALYTLQVRRRPIGISPKAYLLVLFAAGTLLLIPAYLWERAHTPPVEWTAAALGSVAYLVVCASVLAFLAWNEAIRRIGPARTALFGNGIPLLSAIEAVLLLDEEVSAATGVAFVLIGVGLFVANRVSATTGKR
ncbi:MAG: DMT family transporter [Chitinophagaceae bacterium]|nr:MAG: DMT family transporter [Chitinophagaceae bacterium]